jgi:signal transduction histidine kinase
VGFTLLVDEGPVALSQGPDDQLKVPRLAYYGGYTQCEIAGMLLLSLGTVNSRMRLGLERVRRNIKPDMASDINGNDLVTQRATASELPAVALTRDREDGNAAGGPTGLVRQTDRRTAWITGGATVAVLYGVSIAFLDSVGIDRDLPIVAWSVMAVAIGDAVRSRRAYLAAVEERARRAEKSREEEARRRVVEERLRIARELHDLVAHRMAVINVQAGVASHLLRSRPEEAEQALLIARESASEVLDELGEMLSVLRNVDDPEAPVEPAPTLRDLGTLVESFASAGLEVSWESSGTLEGVPDSVQLALFRLAQEGLTNAQRYGDGRASLRVERTPSAVDVTIANRIAGDAGPAAGSGYGLLGMRERVAAVGGTVEIGPTEDGWFRVAAHIPAPRREPG